MPRRRAPARPAPTANHAACACGTGACAASDPHAADRKTKIGPGAHAAGVDQNLKQANLRQLRRIEGQVRGIAAMIEDDRYCADIITQVAAARESLHAVARNLMRNHVRHCASAALRDDSHARDAMIEELLALVGKIAR